jgi:hypothetical protein
VFPHSAGHPSGNEKCCSLASLHPRRAKNADRKGAHDEGSVGGGTLLSREIRSCVARLSGSPREGFAQRVRGMPSQDPLTPERVRRDGLQRGFDEVVEVWRLSARGVAAMTEANQRRPPQRRSRRAGLSSRQIRGEDRRPWLRALTGAPPRISVRGKARGVPAGS